MAPLNRVRGLGGAVPVPNGNLAEVLPVALFLIEPPAFVAKRTLGRTSVLLVGRAMKQFQQCVTYAGCTMRKAGEMTERCRRLARPGHCAPAHLGPSDDLVSEANRQIQACVVVQQLSQR